MRRTIYVLVIIALVIIAIAPALADDATGPAPTPEPLFIQLEPGQTVYMLCATGMHADRYSKDAMAGQCHAAPSR